MKLTTQDGRKLKIDRKLYLHIGGYLKSANSPAQVKVATFTKVIKKFSDGEPYESSGEIVKRYGVVGEYSTNTSRNKAVDALSKAWNSGAEEFTMPQDTFEKTRFEEIEDFCEAHGLGILTLGEPGFTPNERRECARLALETDHWERRGYLVSDAHGNLEKSLAKWKALHPEVAA